MSKTTIALNHQSALYGDHVHGGISSRKVTRVFLDEVPRGDLQGVVIDSPTQIEPGGRVSYQNDFVYRCAVFGATWLEQYWEVDTPETEAQEWGIRHWREIPLTDAQVSAIRAALKSGQKLRHDEFANSGRIFRR
jgi:hypothetical protein